MLRVWKSGAGVSIHHRLRSKNKGLPSRPVVPVGTSGMNNCPRKSWMGSWHGSHWATGAPTQINIFHGDKLMMCNFIEKISAALSIHLLVCWATNFGAFENPPPV